MVLQFSNENFEKSIYNSIKENKIKMEFLEKKGMEYLNIEKKIWESKKRKDEIYEGFEFEYIDKAVYSFSQFIYHWYLEFRSSIRIESLDLKVSSDELSIFYDLLDEVFEIVSFKSLAEEIIYKIKEAENEI